MKSREISFRGSNKTPAWRAYKASALLLRRDDATYVLPSHWLGEGTHFFNPAVQFNTTVMEAGTRSPLRVCTRKRVPSRLGT